MRIVIDFSSNLYSLTPNEIFFLDKCFQLLAKQYAEHEWILEPVQETKGITSLLPLGIKKSIVLDRLKANVFITSGEVYKKNSTALKQIFFFNQRSEQALGKRNAFRYPAAIVTTSPKLKKTLIENFLVDAQRVHVIPAAPSEDVTVADWSEKLSVKDKYSDGREFFFCFKEIGPNSGWEEILKAFSIFKKWQQSSFRLLLSGEIAAGYADTFNEKFNTYKYRNDVKVIDPVKDDIERILPCAFGIICGDADHTGIQVLNAFKVEVPVIASPVDVFDEEMSGTFLPALIQADELSRQLINLYRDEQLRDILIQKGKAAVEMYTWEKSVEQWSSCIGSLSR